MIDCPQTKDGNSKTAFKGKYIENEGPKSVEYLFEMMLTARKQVQFKKSIIS